MAKSYRKGRIAISLISRDVNSVFRLTLLLGRLGIESCTEKSHTGEVMAGISSEYAIANFARRLNDYV